MAAGVGLASPILTDGAESGSLAVPLDGVLESVDAVVADSLEAELHDDVPSIAPSTASRVTVDIAMRLVTRYIASLTHEVTKKSFACHHVDDQRYKLKF